MPWFVHPESSSEPFYVSHRQLPEMLASPDGALCVEVAAPPWKPRASALGGYVACLYRAASDRAWQEHEGDGWEPDPQEDTSHADQGSICHFITQDGVRATFPGPPADHAPTPEMHISAAKLFGGDLERQKDAARRAATVAASLLPKLPNGVGWLAEESWDTGYLTGHTDLRSSDGTILVDLKFTSKPPLHNKVKPNHLPQMASYTRMAKPRKILVIYVDKTNAAWGLPVWIDCMTEKWQWYTDQMMDFAKFLTTDLLYSAATPHLGDHCNQLWCPYQAQCVRRLTPNPGLFFDAIKARRPTGPMKIAVPSWVKAVPA
jgi:hypothetical protein